jgi:proline dehydrogenase
MYRNDRLAYLKRAHQAAVEGGYYYGVKFVRGAYMEKTQRAAERGYPDP